MSSSMDIDTNDGIPSDLRIRLNKLSAKKYEIVEMVDSAGNEVSIDGASGSNKKHRSSESVSSEPAVEYPDREIFGDANIESIALMNASYSVQPVSNEAGEYPYSGPMLVSLNQPKQSYPVVKPHYSEWFKMDSVHDKEKNAFPEFFENTNKKFQELYKSHRDFIIKSYRSNPRIYLSATTCRRMLAADASSILRIHNFLESWGLINYLVDPGTLPVMAGVAADPSSIFDVYKHSAYAGVSPSSEEENKTKTNMAIEDIFCVPSDPKDQLALRKSLVSGPSWSGFSDTMNADEVAATTCTTCSTKFSKQYMACRHEQQKIALCEQCFGEGKYSQQLSSSDFEKISLESDKGEKLDFDGWTPKENLLLLEGLEKHGESWKKIAKSVKTKSAEECIQHFVRMPIEDSYLEQTRNQFGIVKEGSTSNDKPNPFLDTSNPVLAQVAFLSSMISPAVGAAAAQDALKRLNEAADLTETPEELNQRQQVQTPFGPGQLQENDEKNSRHVKVKFPWSVAYLSKSSIRESSNSDPLRPFDSETIEEVSKNSLIAASLKAKELSEVEYRSIVSNVFELVRCQMKKVELKLKHFESLELLLSRERDHLEKCRQKLFAERTQLADARITLQKQADELKAKQEQEQQDQTDMQVDEPPKDEPLGEASMNEVMSI